MFTADDLSWFSETVRGLYAAETCAQLGLAAVSAVHDRFRLVCSACEETASVGARYSAHAVRCETPVPADYIAFVHDHPVFGLMRAAAAPNVFRLSDLISARAWRKTDHFNGVARPIGFNDQFYIMHQSPGGFAAVGLYRDTVFDDVEHAMLGALHQHWVAAWQRVSRPLPPSNTLPRQLTLSAALQPLDWRPAERELLRAYFPGWRGTDALPPSLLDWVREAMTHVAPDPATSALRAFVIESARGRLLVRYFPASRPPAVARLSFVEVPNRPDFFALQARGLSPRECEVLHWIAQGKRDAEIAVVLGCAVRTVGKHVEHLLAKLGVETRVGAVNVAQGWLQVR